ncbi:FGGY-family carbohydrate kinase [Acidihalobacter ferrooxydans]|uniref:Carbohydrate kinase n=1 Tax=Acidihalobacter ferrooxydans TaxID=1765967 RepID=A0A1P8UHN1_9GAMM|nr:FGGY-family carbohydrate kinase [Acidihalobacter ferrooxydans]APZ43284.1 carbohydrate kinase [Acidihalobacter ferrooxydans]
MAGIPVYLGVDVGTSGARALAIDTAGTVRGSAHIALPAPTCTDNGGQQQAPELWWRALLAVLRQLADALPPALEPKALALDGTSGTLLLTDRNGYPLHPALLYADRRAAAQARRIAAVAPAQSGAHGATSALAKLLWLREQGLAHAAHALHQSDWLLGRLGAPWGVSDENNALKLGYDPVARAWPQWLGELDVPPDMLPQVYEPGTPVGLLNGELAAHLGLPDSLTLVAGTTDSVAAFIATGARTPGDGVTSLGSTLALKLVSSRPVFAPEMGIYSHRLGHLWLAGGASNTGGAVLRAHFSDAEIARFSLAIDPHAPTGLDYYPLSRPGERFPVADPDLPPRLTPRPADRKTFFQALLEGIAAVEKLGYARLGEAGADTLQSVRSVGGGAVNTAWTTLRAHTLGVPMSPATHSAAAYGAAVLARQRSDETAHQILERDNREQ